MKKIFLTIAVSCVALSAFAVEPVSPFQVSPLTAYNRAASTIASTGWDQSRYLSLEAGLAVSGISSDAEDIDGSAARTGFHIGFLGGIQLTDSVPLFIEAGIMYVEKGGQTPSNRRGAEDVSYRLGYVEIPLVLRYKLWCGGGASVQPCFGLYVAEGVCGKIKDYTYEEQSDSFDSGFFRRIDAGLRMGCKLAWKLVFFDITYDCGLVNIDTNSFNKTRNNCVTFGLGVDF